MTKLRHLEPCPPKEFRVAIQKLRDEIEPFGLQNEGTWGVIHGAVVDLRNHLTDRKRWVKSPKAKAEKLDEIAPIVRKLQSVLSEIDHASHAHLDAAVRASLREYVFDHHAPGIDEFCDAVSELGKAAGELSAKIKARLETTDVYAKPPSEQAGFRRLLWPVCMWLEINEDTKKRLRVLGLIFEAATAKPTEFEDDMRTTERPRRVSEAFAKWAKTPTGVRALKSEKERLDRQNDTQKNS